MGIFVVQTYMKLGERDKAWQEVKRMLDTGWALTKWQLRYDMRYPFFFGDMPEYQALVATTDDQT